MNRCTSCAPLRVSDELVNVTSCKLDHILLTNMSKNPLHFFKHMIAFYTLKNLVIEITTEVLLFKSEPNIVNAVCYEQLVDRDTQMTCEKEVKVKNIHKNHIPLEDQNLVAERASVRRTEVCRKQFQRMLRECQYNWVSYHVKVLTGKLRIDVTGEYIKIIISAPVWAWQKSGEFSKEESNKFFSGSL